MSRTLTILTAGPGVSVQDMGRPGYLSQGLTQGGAADPVALHEGAALLGQSAMLAAIEMPGMGGTFEASADTRIALTGARMSAKIDDDPVVWNASHLLPAGARLTIGGAQTGAYGYLHVGGGFDTPVLLGARASHLSAGIGSVLEAGTSLPIGADNGGATGNVLTPVDRFGGGAVRIVPSMQTDEFTPETQNRFEATEFRRDARGNRMGVRMDQPGDGFFAADTLSIVSEVIVPGDIQITGDGAPFVLMCECQTTGGYPRIGTVIPCDLPRVAQAQAGTALRFAFVTPEEAAQITARARTEIKTLAGQVRPLVRNPRDIRDLLSYQLVGGVVSAMADPFATLTEEPTP